MSSTELVPFTYEGRQVRTVAINGETWFIARDACGVLEIRNVSQALSYLDDDEKGVITSDTLGGDQRVSILNEAGLYSLILRSRKPEARKFKRWVTHEVIPAIRKTGRYAVSRTIEVPLDHYEQLLDGGKQLVARLREQEVELQEERARYAELEPHAAAGAALTEAEGTLEIGSVANMLEVGRTTLFRWLYAEKILQRNKRPYQEHAHWFRTVGTTREIRDGAGELIRRVVDHTSYLYPAGALELYKHLARKGYRVKKPQLHAVPDLFTPERGIAS